MVSNASDHAGEGGNGTAGAKRRPLIGLTTYRERAATLAWDTEFALLHNAQWHAGQNGEDLRLFAALVAAAETENVFIATDI